VTLLDLIHGDGGTLRKVATTNGGEYAGACPWCGGNDRFRVWPDQDGGRYWCRGCGKTGDAIQYLRERRGLSFREACDLLGRDPGPQSSGPQSSGPQSSGPQSSGPRPVAAAAWTPRETSAPPTAWQERARSFLDQAIDLLWLPAGEPIREWLLNEKGLQDATIKAAGLGFNPAEKYESRGTWGLPAAHREDGTERRQWIPAGLVIPHIVGGAVHRLRIRRNDPGDGSRYVIASGSSARPMILNSDRAALVVVESEIDAILLHQEAGDLAGVVAMGTATAKPDRITHDLLTTAAVILVSLDTDEAGAKAAWSFWPDTYGDKVRRWPCIGGKDQSEARLNGLNLRSWVVAGLFETEERFERFCIMTIDGGVTDGEALLINKSQGGHHVKG